MHELFNFNLSFFVSPGWVFDMSEVMIYANHTQEGEMGGDNTGVLKICKSLEFFVSIILHPT